MIEVRKLSFRYSRGKLALDNISAVFPQEHVLAVLGESGSGKTTLLRCMGGFLKPAYLLLDEPTSALDMNTTHDFGLWLLELKTNTTFIVVTHDVPFAKAVASSGIWLADGHVKAEGRIDSIIRNCSAARPPRAGS